MKLIKGKFIAEKILRGVKKKIGGKKEKLTLAVLLVGKNKASETYVNIKKKMAKKLGVSFLLLRLKTSISGKKIIEIIRDLNAKREITGIIVQLPLPDHLDVGKIVRTVDPKKDVDGFHPRNNKLFERKKEIIWPVFARAILSLIEHANESIAGKKAVVIANSPRFGRTMNIFFRRKKVRSEFIKSSNVNKKVRLVKRADIIVVAAGKQGLIKKEMVKKGAIVIDGGINRKGRKVRGDVDTGVRKVAGYLSPVPGGVGPLTVAYLFENLVKLANLRKK
jgi:methylenetetrahydrofolate dehydrogenase (NADP+)/methenyltetrahydrofolate cyclohydrolase